MIPALPQRKTPEPERLKLKKFSEFLGRTDDEIRNNSYTAVNIDDIEILKSNFDLLERIINLGYEKVFSLDYSSLEFIESNLKSNKPVELSLIDDFQNRDRTYINSLSFEKNVFVLPLTYLMWNPTIKDGQPISFFSDKQSMSPYALFYKQNMSSDTIFHKQPSVSKEVLIKFKDIINKLYEKYQNFDDEEKTILISDYLQNLVQYVDENNISEGVDGIYITKSGEIIPTYNKVRNLETVLFDNYGICSAIANATTILLNNPTFNVNIRSVHGDGHVWNVVNILDKNYYVDNTWSITRNKNRYAESLKAKSFCSDYLFFGSDTAFKIGHHTASSYHPIIEQKDMDREHLKNSQKRLVKVAKFNNYNRPIFESHLQNN